MIKNIQDETKIAVVAMESGNKQVEEGVSSTTKAGDSLRAIIKMSEEVGGMITEIATAATQQSSTTEQVKSTTSSRLPGWSKSPLSAPNSRPPLVRISPVSRSTCKHGWQVQAGGRHARSRREQSPHWERFDGDRPGSSKSLCR